MPVTISEAKRDAKEFRARILDVAKNMKVKVPRGYYAPGPSKMLTAGQYVKIWRIVKAADPDQEFKQSLCSWAPMPAKFILLWEIRPAVHERINARALIASNLN